MDTEEGCECVRRIFLGSGNYFSLVPSPSGGVEGGATDARKRDCVGKSRFERLWNGWRLRGRLIAFLVDVGIEGWTLGIRRLR